MRITPLLLAPLVALGLAACNGKDDIPTPKTDPQSQGSDDGAKAAAAKAVESAKEAASRSGEAASTAAGNAAESAKDAAAPDLGAVLDRLRQENGS